MFTKLELLPNNIELIFYTLFFWLLLSFLEAHWAPKCFGTP